MDDRTAPLDLAQGFAAIAKYAGVDTDEANREILIVLPCSITSQEYRKAWAMNVSQHAMPLHERLHRLPEIFKSVALGLFLPLLAYIAFPLKFSVFPRGEIAFVITLLIQAVFLFFGRQLMWQRYFRTHADYFENTTNFLVLVSGLGRYSRKSIWLTPWRDIKTIIDSGEYLFILTKRYQATIIPKRNFKTEEEVENFKAIITDLILSST